MTKDPIARGLEVGTSRPPIQTLLRQERQVLTGVLGGDRSDKGRNDPEPQTEYSPPPTRVEPPRVETARVVATTGRVSRLPLIAGAGVLALLLGGGGYALMSGGSDDDPRVGASATAPANATPGGTVAPSTPSTPAAPAVVARVLVPGTSTLAGGSGAAAVALTAGQEVPGGSTITVRGGPAAIRFTDGSILRLDSGAAFTTDAASGTRGSLTAGRAWARAAGAYSMTTPSGPVTAGAGSAFALDCSGACRTFTFAGSVSGPGGTVAAGYGTIGGAVKPTNWDMTFALPFLKASADADARVNAAFPDALGLSKRIGVRFASYAGTFTGIRTRTACTGTDCGDIPNGNKAARTYVFGVICAKGFPCTATGTTQYQQGEVTKSARVPMTYDGRQIRYTFKFGDVNCTDGTGRFASTFVWTFKPVTAGAVKGVWAVTRTTGSAFVTNRSSAAGSCGAQNGTNTGTIDVRRKG